MKQNFKRLANLRRTHLLNCVRTVALTAGLFGLTGLIARAQTISLASVSSTTGSTITLQATTDNTPRSVVFEVMYPNGKWVNVGSTVSSNGAANLSYQITSSTGFGYIPLQAFFANYPKITASATLTVPLVIDTDKELIGGSNNTFYGVPMQVGMVNGIVRFYVKGDIDIPAAPVTITGRDPLSLFAANNVNIGTGTTFNVSAVNQTARFGGGAGGNSVGGVAGGTGGAGGTGSIVGGAGGQHLKTYNNNKGQPGAWGKDGKTGTGNPGNAGNAGLPGWLSPLSGGPGGSAPTAAVGGASGPGGYGGSGGRGGSEHENINDLSGTGGFGGALGGNGNVGANGNAGGGGLNTGTGITVSAGGGGGGASSGASGSGGGGAGGTVKLLGSAVFGNGGYATIVDTTGGTGTGGAGTSGQNGRFILARNNQDPFLYSPFGTNEEDYTGMTVVNPFIVSNHISGNPLIYTPLIPDLPGGADGFGLLSSVASDIPGLLSNAPANATIALVLCDTSLFGDSAEFTGMQYLLMVNLSAKSLSSPAMSVGSSYNAFNLLQGGIKNCNFFPGDSGPVVIKSLAPDAIYGTFIPTTLDAFNVAGGTAHDEGILRSWFTAVKNTSGAAIYSVFYLH